MLRRNRLQARGVFRYEEPRFVPWVYAFAHLASPVYDRWVEGIVIAFRHTAVHDAQVIFYLITRILPREARSRRQALGGLPPRPLPVGPLETGSARLAVWCLEDLQRKGRSEEVLVLPVGLEYWFPRNPEGLLETLITRITRIGGLRTPSPKAPAGRPPPQRPACGSASKGSATRRCACRSGSCS